MAPKVFNTNLHVDLQRYCWKWWDKKINSLLLLKLLHEEEERALCQLFDCIFTGEPMRWSSCPVSQLLRRVFKRSRRSKGIEVLLVAQPAVSCLVHGQTNTGSSLKPRCTAMEKSCYTDSWHVKLDVLDLSLQSCRSLTSLSTLYTVCIWQSFFADESDWRPLKEQLGMTRQSTFWRFWSMTMKRRHWPHVLLGERW